MAGNVFIVSSITVEETEVGSWFVSATVALAGPANAAESKEVSPVVRVVYDAFVTVVTGCKGGSIAVVVARNVSAHLVVET